MEHKQEFGHKEPLIGADFGTTTEEDVSFFHDFVAGGVAGSASVVVGHPFDTIKVGRHGLGLIVTMHTRKLVLSPSPLELHTMSQCQMAARSSRVSHSMSIFVLFFSIAVIGPYANIVRGIRRHMGTSDILWWSLVTISWYGSSLVDCLCSECHDFLKLWLEFSIV
jgi:hypothetical protein